MDSIDEGQTAEIQRKTPDRTMEAQEHIKIVDEGLGVESKRKSLMRPRCLRMCRQC